MHLSVYPPPRQYVGDSGAFDVDLTDQFSQWVRHLANMDTGTSGNELEEARASLRAAGVTSLDRTQTIYPVSFEPSDWYKYLLPL